MHVTLIGLMKFMLNMDVENEQVYLQYFTIFINQYDAD